MTLLRYFFRLRRRRAQSEAERLTQEILERARQALHGQAALPARAPDAARQFEPTVLLRVRPSSLTMEVLRGHPEPAIIGMCLAICTLGVMQTYMH